MSEYTVKELKDIARDKGFKGFSTMGKADLLKALQHAGYIKSHSPQKASRSARKASRSARKASRSARKSPKKSRSRRSARKSRSSPSSVKKAVIGDFKKMLKADLVKLIKKTDASFDIKATMKKDELIHVLEQMISRVTRPLSPATGLSVAELKRYALNDRGWKVGSMTKDNILETLSRESCNPEAGRFCSNASDTCDTRYNTCTGGAVSGKGLDEIVIDGHKIVGSSKSIAELKKKLSLKKVSPKKVSPKKVSPKKVSPKKVSPKKVSPKKVSPKKVSPKKGHTPLEQTLDEMTRGGVATREFRENLERLKACLGLAPN
jgi:hypothetical protein